MPSTPLPARRREGMLGVMLIREPAAAAREPRTVELATDLVVVGGGMAGCCAAIAAARAGSKVVLLHDRPVLGGNASSEIRLWVLGATCHMGSNNRWAREGGIIDEILTENLWRNQDSNPLIFDSVLLEWVAREANLTLLLNTAVHACEKHGAPSQADGAGAEARWAGTMGAAHPPTDSPANPSTDKARGVGPQGRGGEAPELIKAVLAWNAQNQTRYRVTAPLFLDSSGDGVLGFQAGAAFRMGAEPAEEFGEPFAPAEEYGSLLGHSLYFYTKDVGYDVPFVAPEFALKDIEGTIPRWRDFKGTDNGCRLWWIEWGGRLDTVHDSERIKWELWKVAYGVWGWMKNSGRFPETRTMALEWFGHVPGKRESRRFEGDHILTQGEVVAQTRFSDEVAYGGWAFDLHPADGVYSKHAGCTHIRAHGVYGIPFRSLYSQNIGNLLLGGRVISVSHVAFGTTRVMGTLASCGQAAGTAAALCRRHGCLPRELAGRGLTSRLQQDLLRAGAHLPSHRYTDADDLARGAAVTLSSRLRLAALPSDGASEPLDRDRGVWLPLPAGRAPRLTLRVDAAADTIAVCELRACSRDGFHTPDEVLARIEVPVPAGADRAVVIDPGTVLDRPRYVLAAIAGNPQLRVRTSPELVSGVLAVRRGHEQTDVARLGFHDFAWWSPQRRPAAQTLALELDPPLDAFGTLNSGWHRPTATANWWVADPADAQPTVTLRWPQPVEVGEVVVFTDPDYEHPMEHVLFRHHDRASPYAVRDVVVRDGTGRVLAEVRGNHHGVVRLRLAERVRTQELRVEVAARGEAPAPIAAVRVYGG